MTHPEPFLQLMGLSIIGTLFSFIEMNEALRFVILVSTSIGVLVKTWEQIRRSERFQQDITSLWKKTKQKFRKTREK